MPKAKCNCYDYFAEQFDCDDACDCDCHNDDSYDVTEPYFSDYDLYEQYPNEVDFQEYGGEG